MYSKSSFSKSGFALTELVVVIGIIAILLSISWVLFSDYSRKSQIEKQTRMLYSDLMEARSNAMFEKKIMTLQFTSNSYTVLADGIVTKTEQLKYPLTLSNSLSVVYDTRGVLQNAAVDGKTICANTQVMANVDSIIVSMTMIKIGKLKEGASCAANNVIEK